MKKLLYISELGNRVSYSYVSKTLKTILEERFDVYYFCVRNLGNECLNELINDGYDKGKLIFIREDLLKINNEYIKNEDYKKTVANGILQLEEVINNVKPDLIITLGDTELVKTQCIKIKNIGYKGILIPYITIDTSTAIKDWFDYERDFMLTVSDHSRKILKDYGFKNIESLNHITNENNYKELDLESKQRARIEIFQTDKYNDYFIVGSLNCNSYRKKWDILIKSFCIFAKNKSKCLLLLKTIPYNNTNDIIYGGYNIINLIDYYSKIYNINPDNFKILDRHLNVSHLNSFYNICDVFLNTTSGEGWGLTNIEAALCKTPIILPKTTSLIEIFGDDYLGYLEGKLYSSNIARGPNYLDIDSNRIDNLFCYVGVFYEDYKYNEIKYQDIIENNDNIPIIYLGSNHYENNKIIKSFKTYNDFLNYYDTEILPKYFKVYASVEFNLIEELYSLFDTHSFFLKKHKYKIIHISKLTVKNSCSISSNALVDIVSSNKTAEIINRFYKDENIRNKSKNYVYNKVKGKYTYEKIKLQFNNIMDQWNL